MPDDIQTEPATPRPPGPVAGYSYVVPPEFQAKWRPKPRIVAISTNLIAIVGSDGTASSLKFVPDPADGSRASIVYGAQDLEDFVLLHGEAGPAWMAFHQVAEGLRKRTFVDRNTRLNRIGIAILLCTSLGMFAWLQIRQSQPLVLHFEAGRTSDYGGNGGKGGI